MQQYLSMFPMSCLRFLLILLTVLCTVVFNMPEDFVTFPYHLGFRDFILVRRSSHTPVLFWTSHSSHGIHRKWSAIVDSISPHWLGLFLQVLYIKPSFYNKEMFIKGGWASSMVMFSIHSVPWTNAGKNFRSCIPRYLKFPTASCLWLVLS